MKRLPIILLVLVLALRANAQVYEGLSVINFQIGDNTLWAPDKSTPHFRLTYEYELMTDAFDVESLCIGVGASLGYRYMEKSLNYKEIINQYRCITWALRGTAHYDVLGQFLGMHSDHLDPYATLSIGADHYDHHSFSTATGKETTDLEGNPYIPNQWRYRLVPGLILGCRYWFTPNIGAMAEIGCDGFSFFNIGVSTCF